MTTSTCAKPTSFETLVALWAGDLGVEESAAIEEHLFACDACATASDRLAKLIGGLHEIIPPVISHAHRARLVAKGMRILVTPVEAEGKERARFAPDVDLLVHALRADFSQAERVDIELVTLDGVSRLSFEDVPFDSKAGEVLIACQRHYEALFPSDPIFRVHAVEGGARRRVGDYFVHHEWK